MSETESRPRLDNDLDEVLTLCGSMNEVIGRLDRLLSEMMILSKNLLSLDLPDRLTLKHHAEDMKGAAEVILKRIDAVQGNR